MIIGIISVLGQINLNGFEEVAQQNTLFAILVSIILILFRVIIYLYKKVDDKAKLLGITQENHSLKIEEIRKEQIKKEDERNIQWRESEKETLTVLNGVNSVLEMSEKMKENDTQKIIDKISSIDSSIKTVIDLTNKNKNG